VADIVWFTDAESTDNSVTGGKGANLGVLAQAGFEVPPGFAITTSAYTTFLVESGLDRQIAAALDGLDYGDLETVEDVTSGIRALIEGAQVPGALGAAIAAAHGELGAEYVAVRSSGAAEDLADASFAGLHDTYLDVQGADDTVDAVKRCWASLWTARATTYRNRNGFDHFESPIAVVVQKMISSEASGVMFTANPLNAYTDEFVINSSWGLGEAIVQGITTPDEYIVKRDTSTYPDSRRWIPRGHLRISMKTLGGKAKQIVRDPVSGKGVVVLDTPDSDRSRFTLTDAQACELAAIGQRVQEHYDGFPQDIEWALADGRFYLLQARPITGVEFNWDCEVNASVPAGERDDWIWSRRWADEAWTGAVTPLMYSWRCYCWHEGMKQACARMGLPELMPEHFRMWRFHRGRVFFNAQVERLLLEKTVPPPFRPAMAATLPPTWRQEVIDAPFSYLKYLKMWAHLHMVAPEAGYNWTKHTQAYIYANQEAYNGLPRAELPGLTDLQLREYLQHMFRIEHEWYGRPWIGLLYIYRDAVSLLGQMVAHWYKGEDPHIFHELLTGTVERSITAIENDALWKLQHRIRESPALREAFDAYPNDEFLAQCELSEDGKAWLAEYATFVKKHGHRGAADREFYYPRRVDDFSIDYRALKSLLTGDEIAEPEVTEREVNKRRDIALQHVVEDIRMRPFGQVKAELFKHVFEYVHKILVVRDNEREFVERPCVAIKHAFAEINRRAVERGIFDNDRDYYFLTMQELYAAVDRGHTTALDKAKIAARAKDFFAADDKSVTPPVYLQRGLPVHIADANTAQDGVLRGMPTSRGQITGTARVIKTLDDIGRVNQGEILVTFSTDPGWTPIFLNIKGVVVETGGMLAHSALLAREYGFPAAQIEGAMANIPDGATITLDGDTGTVTLIDEPELETTRPAAELVEVS